MTDEQKPYKTPVSIEPRIRRHAQAVLDIDERGYPLSEQWGEEKYNNILTNEDDIGMVAELQEKIVGHTLFHREANNITILRFVVDPDYRRQDIGKQMIERLTRMLSYKFKKELIIDIPENNTDARLFFQTMGFVGTGLNEDKNAFVMRLHVSFLDPKTKKLRTDITDEEIRNFVSQYISSEQAQRLANPPPSPRETSAPYSPITPDLPQKPQEATLAFQGGEVAVHASAPNVEGKLRYTFMTAENIPTTLSLTLAWDFSDIVSTISKAIESETTALGAMAKIAAALEKLTLPAP